MSDLVECHAGYTYPEHPIALFWKEMRLEITQILNEWHEPENKCFRVQTSDQKIFNLFYNLAEDKWRIKEFG